MTGLSAGTGDATQSLVGGRGHVWLWWVVGLVACTGPRPVPMPAPAGGPGLTVTLAWTAPADLDLYVTEPERESVYYALPRSRHGGMFLGDARCADGARQGGEERARWTDPPPGRYRVGVDLPELCAGRARQVPYRLVVEYDGRIETVEGRARLGEREPQAFEFVVPPRVAPGSAR